MSHKHSVDTTMPPSEAMTEDESGTASSIKNTLSEHKGKLAIGVAATLGLMVFYKWREKQLAKDDPEDYARLQRLKAGVKTSELRAKHEENENSRMARLTDIQQRQEKEAGAS
jgi:uncharacterized protein HemX